MDNYDVVICGGGIAGLTLARQLKQTIDGSILLVDRTSRPLPTAGHKVGESTVEVGAFYMSQLLKMEDFLEKRHLHKLGLRYFFGDPSGPFWERPEYGQSRFPEIHSYQIDRGEFENDMRRIVNEQGVDLLEGTTVKDIRISKESEHIVDIESQEGETRSVKCRWVIDATGRRCIIQKKLGLTIPSEDAHSSSWWRVPGRVTEDDFVGPEHKEWHDRVPGKIRWHSTTHLMGDGYWVWLIPLSSENTSIGIVAKEGIHPFNTFNTYEKSLQWLKTNEPFLFEKVKDMDIIDFKVMRGYTYFSKQILSKERWACSGEAGQFADPFYSPGMDLIGFTNCSITEAIKLDFENKLNAEKVDFYNNFLCFFAQSFTKNIQSSYPYHGNAMVMGCKLLWDFVSGWSTSGTMMFSQFFLDDANKQKIFAATSSFTALSRSMQKFFIEWSKNTKRINSYSFLDYLSVPFISELRLRSLKKGRSEEQLLKDQEENMRVIKELALAIFRLGIEDCHPDEFQRISNGNLNPLGIDFSPDLWEKKGLFNGPSSDAASRSINDQFRKLFSL